MIMVSFFTDALSAGSKSVVRNKALVRKINLPREMFPVASIMVSVYHMIAMYVIILIGCVLSGWQSDPMAFVAALMAFAIVLRLGAGVGAAPQRLQRLLPRRANVVDVIQTIITWTVPMIYPFCHRDGASSRSTHQWLYELYLASPLVHRRTAQRPGLLAAGRPTTRSRRRPAAAPGATCWLRGVDHDPGRPGVPLVRADDLLAGSRAASRRSSDASWTSRPDLPAPPETTT